MGTTQNRADGRTSGADKVTSYAEKWPGHSVTVPYVGDERTLLTSYLDWHREVIELKCQGVPTARLSERAVAPSELTLHGIVRHLTGVEEWWLHHQFAGGPFEDIHYYSAENPAQDFTDLTGDFGSALSLWRDACTRSREIVAAAGLEDTGTLHRSGDPVSLRRILIHLIAEYARHAGHVDLIRERIDGATGH